MAYMPALVKANAQCLTTCLRLGLTCHLVIKRMHTAKYTGRQGGYTVRVLSQPNSVPATSGAQGAPRDAYFKQSPHISALHVKMLIVSG